MADRIEEVQVLLQKRNIRSHGPMASNQINSMQAELVHDLAAISDQWNNRLTPLTEGLPDGSDDSSVDAFLYGLDGKHMYVDQRATLTLNSSYFNSSANRPNTLSEQFGDIYASLSTIREDLESEIAALTGQASQISIEDNGNLYSSANVENALQEVMTAVNSISVSGLTPDLSAVNEHYIPALDNTYDIGSATYRMRDVYVGPGSFTMVAKSSLGEAPSDKTFAFEVDSSTGKMQILDSTSVMLEMQSTEIVARQTFKVNAIEDGPASNDITFSPTGQVKVSGADLVVEHDGSSGTFVTARMTTAERNALTPQAGMFIYNETTGGFEGYAGGSWGEVGGGGTAGGSDGQIQYNDGSSFGGASEFVYDDVNNSVGIGQPASSTWKLNVGGSLRLVSDGPTSIQTVGYVSGSPDLAYQLWASRGTEAIPANVQLNDKLGSFIVHGRSEGFWPFSEIAVEVDKTPSGGYAAQRMVFLTAPDNNTDPVEAMRIDSNQSVGIGFTPSATVRLGVQKDSDGQIYCFVGRNASAGTSASTRLQVDNGTGNVSIIQQGVNGSGTTGGVSNAGIGDIIGQANTGLRIRTTTSVPLYLMTNDTLAMTIDASQIVRCQNALTAGGTITAIEGNLNAYRSGSGNSVVHTWSTFSSTATKCTEVWFRRSRSDTANTWVATQTGDRIAQFQFIGARTGGGVEAAALRVEQTAASTSEVAPSDFVFLTSNTGDTIPQERMRLARDGKLILQDALTLASTTDTTAGNVRWNGSNFQGYTGSAWVNLDTQGGTPAGSDTQIQFNDGGSSFGASSNFVYNTTTKSVSIGGVGNAYRLSIDNRNDPTSTLGAVLHLVSNDDTYAYVVAYSGSGPGSHTTKGGHIRFWSARGDSATPADVSAGDRLCYLECGQRGFGGNTYYTPFAEVYADNGSRSNRLVFNTLDVNGAVQEAMRITFQQKVLIGTTTPPSDALMAVDGAVVIGDVTGASAPNGTLRWTGTDFQGRVAAGWRSLTQQGTVTGPAGSDGQIQYNNGGSAFGGASALYYDDSTNRVGIGTTSPEARLVVISSARIRTHTGSAGDAPATFSLYATRGTEGTPTDLNADDWYGRISFAGRRGGTAVEGARINAYAFNNWTTTNYAELVFETAGTLIGGGSSNTPQPRMKIAYTGEVGIGDFSVLNADSPEELLHVRYDYDGRTGVKIDNNTSGTNVEAYLNLNAGSDLDGNDLVIAQIRGVGPSYFGASRSLGSVLESRGAGGMHLGSANASGDVSIYSGNALAMTLDSNQRVGIGQSSPTVPLQITTDGSDAVAVLERFGGSITQSTVRSSRGTESSPSPTISGDVLGVFSGAGRVTTSIWGSPSANMRFVAAENFQLSQQGTHIVWQTMTAGGQILAEKMRLTDAGRLGVGDFSSTTVAEEIHLKVDQNSGTAIRIENTNATSNCNSYLAVKADAEAAFFQQLGTTCNSGHFGENVAGRTLIEATGIGGLGIGTYSNTDVVFATNDAVRARITNAGKVGIGSTSPDELLTLYSSTEAKVKLNTSHESNYSEINFYRSEGGTETFGGRIDDGDILGKISFTARWDDEIEVAGEYESAAITCQATEDWTTLNGGGSELLFNVTENDTTSQITAMLIHDDGDIDVASGLKLGGATTAEAGRLQWDGTNFQGHDGASWKNLDVQGGAPVYTVTSSKTTTYNANAGEVVRCDPSGGGFQVNLPTASGVEGETIVVKNTTSSTNTITISRSGSDTIDGATTTTIAVGYGSITFVSYGGTAWGII